MIKEGLKMTDLFTIIHPPMPLEFQAIQDFINAAYVLGLKADTSNGNGEQHKLLIRGKK